MVFSATAIKQSFWKINKPKSYSIWYMVYIYIYAQLQQISSIYLLRLRCYTSVGQVRVISDLAVILQMDLSPALITMANSHRFDDVAYIGIRLGTGNRKYTVCINSLLPCLILFSLYPVCISLWKKKSVDKMHSNQSPCVMLHWRQTTQNWWNFPPLITMQSNS